MRIDLLSCTVRPWQAIDKASLVRFADNRNVWRNLTHKFPHPYTEADADAWLSFVHGTEPRVHFAIEVDGLAVGGISTAPLEGIFARTAELGYWLGEPYWNRGIATEAGRSIVAYAFEQLDVGRVEAAVFEWNPASMRVLEKLGFAREGILRRSAYKDGLMIDRVMYACIRT